jgi:hypothetical protein
MKLLEKLGIDRQTLIVGIIFIVCVIAMLAWAIHAVDMYNGTFP